MVRRRTLLVAAPSAVAVPWVSLARVNDEAVRWAEPVELARGAGLRGPWQQNDSRYDFVDDPAVVFRPDGSLVVAWVDQARKAVVVRRLHADGRPASEPQLLSGEPDAFSWMPRIACGADGTVYVLWQEIVFSGGSHGGEMLLARPVDGAGGFGAPLNLSASRGGDGKGRITPEYWHNGSCDLIALPGGGVAAAWTEYDGPLWFTRSTDGGRTYARPVRVAGGRGERPGRAPSLAVARDALLLAWTMGEQPDADIRVARLEAGAEKFGMPVEVRSPGYSDAPRLAVDAHGTVHLAWGEARDGPFQAQRVLYSRSRDGGRGFETPREPGRMPEGSASAGFPSLAVGAGGSVIALAELQDDLRQRPRGLLCAVSRDGGDRFDAWRTVPGSRDPGGGFNGSSQGLLIPKLAVRNGEVAVVNSALREGSHSRVWLVRGRLA